jgi:hypothetical protein
MRLRFLPESGHEKGPHRAGQQMQKARWAGLELVGGRLHERPRIWRSRT